MPSKSRVALISCDSYGEQTVFAAVQKGIDLLGGMSSFIRPDEKIVLKPNVLAGDAPDKLIGPHPLVFKAVARLAQMVTANLSYGDSPAFGKPAAQIRRSGLADIARELGIPQADFEHGREVQFHDSPLLKSFVLADGVLEADGLISIGKCKTHQLMRITGAIKNQLGCVPGMLKAEFHIKLPNPLDFAKMLVCLNLYLRPRLYILDGVMAMQGNGPRNGDPVKLNALIVSADPVAADAVFCRLIGLDPECVPTMKPGREWGLGTYLAGEIELLGDPLEPLVQRKFNVVRAPVAAAAKTSGAMSFARNLVSSRPVIDASQCNKCGICVQVCPAAPNAVDWPKAGKTKPPVYAYRRCIRCFCCQEVCPESAISVRKPLLRAFRVRRSDQE